MVWGINGDDLASVLRSVEIPIVVLGHDSRLRMFTPAAARIFGCLSTDIGRSIDDVKPMLAMVPALARIIPEGLTNVRPAECDAQGDDGRWYHVTARPYVTLDGRVDGAVITAQDVSAEKGAAERLADARKYAEDILDTVRGALVVLDRTLHVHSGNKAFQRAFRLNANDIEGKRLDELGRAELADPSLRKLITELRAGDTVEGFRMEQGDAAGGGRVFMLNARHIDATPLVLLAIEDVTEAERAASAVYRIELGLRDVLIHATEAIFMLDAAGNIIFVNHAAAAMFGYAADELAGQSVDVLVPEPAREIHARHRAGFMADPSARSMGRDRELTGRRKDGTELHIEVVLSPASSDDGPRVVAFVADVTSRRAAIARIHQYQHKLQGMAFDRAKTEEGERRRIAVELHDRIGQSLALAEIKLTSVRDGITGKARAAVEDAIGLLERSIVETRSLTFELSPPVLYDLGLAEALSWLAEDIEKRQGLRIELADDGAEKSLDQTTRALVFRAVREILTNVFKHAKTSVARVSLRRADDHYEIAIEDSGVGFAQDAVFDRIGGGFGLLSVREQLRRLGGTLAITSAPGQGTQVHMRLPLTADTPPNEKRTP